MRRWGYFSTDVRRAAFAGALFGALAVGGLLSERNAFGWRDVASWLPDFVVGMTLVGSAVWAAPRSRGTGVLLAAAGGAWFVANVWPDTRLVYLGVVVQMIVAFAGWRLRSRRDLAIVVVGYVAAFGSLGWDDPGVAIVLSAAVVVLVGERARRSSTRRRAEDRAAAIAATVLAGGTIGASALRWSGLGDIAPKVPVLWYEASIIGVVGVLCAALATRRSAVADVVVELSADRSGTLREALAATLGDPSLQIGYWDGSKHYLDGIGAIVQSAPAGDGRTVTFVDDDGTPFAVVVHDPNVLNDPTVVDAVATATRLWAAHAELRGIVDSQITELAASRRRLLSAADEERRALDERLRRGAERRLNDLRVLVRDALAGQPDSARLARIERLVDESIDDLRDVAAGLHPRDLGLGLDAALAALAARCPIVVDVAVEASVGDTRVGTAIYYVCAEALTNSTKHGSATHVTIRIAETAGVVTLVVADDGTGGADVGRGSGLRGLVDRVEALGGRLELRSDAGSGTRISAVLPRDVELVGEIGR